jgi:hypothetical protein
VRRPVAAQTGIAPGRPLRRRTPHLRGPAELDGAARRSARPSRGTSQDSLWACAEGGRADDCASDASSRDPGHRLSTRIRVAAQERAGLIATSGACCSIC